MYPLKIKYALNALNKAVYSTEKIRLYEWSHVCFILGPTMTLIVDGKSSSMKMNKQIFKVLHEFD